MKFSVSALHFYARNLHFGYSRARRIASHPMLGDNLLLSGTVIIIIILIIF